MAQLHTYIIKLAENKSDDMVAFGGGSILSWVTWMHVSPNVILGKLIMTFVVGLIGGIGGVTAKALCNCVAKLYKEWKQKKRVQN
jgi:capsular polysaccharide biosynthesis protein